MIKSCSCTAADLFMDNSILRVIPPQHNKMLAKRSSLPVEAFRKERSCKPVIQGLSLILLEWAWTRQTAACMAKLSRR